MESTGLRKKGLFPFRSLPTTRPELCPEIKGSTATSTCSMSRSSEDIITKKINVCGNMRHQDLAKTNEPVVDNLHSYMSSIRGTASYWKQYTGDILAMILRLGVPTFFLTVSFDDLGSPDVLKAMWSSAHGITINMPDPLKMKFEERRDLLNSNPVAAARHFNLRAQELIRLLTTDNTIFGKPVSDYTFRVEFQD